MSIRQRRQPCAFAIREPTLRTDQDGPWLTLFVRRQTQGGANFGLIAKHQVPTLGPCIQKAVEPLQIGHLGHEGAAALLGGLNGVGLQTVLPDALGIGELGLHGQYPRRAHFRCFFNDEIGARLFDRGKQEPQIRRQLQRFGLFHTAQNATALAGLGHLGQPFSVLAIEQGNLPAHSQPHDAKQVMRLLARQIYRLPRTQRVLYIQSDLCTHETLHMQGNAPTPDGQVADAVSGNWVDTHAPAFARPYLRLSRADRPIGTWLLLIPCWWGLALAILSDGNPRWEDLWIAIGCAIGAFLMRGAGCTWNDITDREFDGQVERTRSRPIPSGQVSVKQAVVWMGLQCLLALGILLTFNQAAIAMGVLSLLPVTIYPYAKRFTWWPQVFLGLAFNWGILLTWAAHTGTVGVPAITLYLAGIAWTLFYDTIYAHQDAEDDELIGIKSTARLFGKDTARWLKYFLVATVFLMGLAIIDGALSQASLLALAVALAGPWAMGWHMAWQLRGLDTEDNAKLLQLFRANRDTGLIPLIFLCVALLL